MPVQPWLHIRHLVHCVWHVPWSDVDLWQKMSTGIDKTSEPFLVCGVHHHRQWGPSSSWQWPTRPNWSTSCSSDCYTSRPAFERSQSPCTPLSPHDIFHLQLSRAGGEWGDFFILYIFHPTSSKASLSSSIPSFSLDFLTASWRVMRRRLWMAKTFVLLFTSTKGSFWLSSKEPFSRIMKSFKASFKCFRMTCLWRLVTSQPIMSITASTLTSSPYFSGSGKPPGNIADRDQISIFSNTFLITHEDPLWYKSLVASWFCFWFRIRSSP